MKIKLRDGINANPAEAIDSILTQRGVIDIEAFKHPTIECELDYRDLDNLEAGANMLMDAIENDKRIAVLVDADCDGFTSSSIMWNYIKDYRPQARLEYIVQDGKRHGLEHVVEQLLHFDLVIVPDGGTNDLKQFEQLHQADVNILVIDHHQAEYEGYDSIPNNVVIINNQMSKNYADKNLCGAGMCYKFCQKLDNMLGLSNAHNYIDLAALGEIADAANRTDIETNWIITEGLRNIRNEAFKALLESLEHSLGSKSYAPFYNLTATDVGFYVAPLINAIVRVGTIEENSVMFRAFIEPEAIVPVVRKRGAKPGDTETAIEQTIRVGNSCKRRQNTIKEEVLERLEMEILKSGKDDDKILVIDIDDSYDMPTSMTGLVANNLVSKYQRPVLLGRISDEGYLRGSIRGNDNFKAIPRLKEFLESTGYFNLLAGHSNAAGYSIPVENVEPFVKYCNETFNEEDFETCYNVDYDLYADDARLEGLLLKIASCPEYWGNGIDEVMFSIKNIPLNSVLFMGTNKDTIKIHHNGIDYIRFKDSAFADAIAFGTSGFINIVGRAKLNDFRGKVSIQVQVEDYEFTAEDRNHKFEF